MGGFVSVDNSKLVELRRAASLKDYATACAPEYDATMEHDAETQWPVIDVVAQTPIDKSDEIVVMSDGRCYSKRSLLQNINSGVVDDTTGRPYLPSTRAQLTDDDYRQLGVEPPTEAEITERRSQQRETLFTEVGTTQEQQERTSRYRLWKLNITEGRGPRIRTQDYFIENLQKEETGPQKKALVRAFLDSLPDRKRRFPMLFAAYNSALTPDEVSEEMQYSNTTYIQECYNIMLTTYHAVFMSTWLANWKANKPWARLPTHEDARAAEPSLRHIIILAAGWLAYYAIETRDVSLLSALCGSSPLRNILPIRQIASSFLPTTQPDESESSEEESDADFVLRACPQLAEMARHMARPQAEQYLLWKRAILSGAEPTVFVFDRDMATKFISYIREDTGEKQEKAKLSNSLADDVFDGTNRFTIYYAIYKESLTAEEIGREIQQRNTTFVKEYMEYYTNEGNYIEAWVTAWKERKPWARLPSKQDADELAGRSEVPRAFFSLAKHALKTNDAELYGGLCGVEGSFPSSGGERSPSAIGLVARATISYIRTTTDMHERQLLKENANALITQACPSVASNKSYRDFVEVGIHYL